MVLTVGAHPLRRTEPTVGGMTTSPATAADAELELRRRERIRYQNDPVGYARDWLGVTLTEDACAFLESIRDNRQTAVAGANATGKTHTAAVGIVWWMDCFSETTDTVVYTGSTSGASLKAGVWTDIRTLIANAKRPVKGELAPRAPEWYISHDCFAKAKTAASEEGFKGKHATRLLILLEEAVGCPSWMWKAAGTMAAERDNRIAAIANPTELSGDFFDCFNTKAGAWTGLRMAAPTHPNVTSALSALGMTWEEYEAAPGRVSEKLPEDFEYPISGAISLERLDDRKLEYGIDSADWAVQTLGQFPDASDLLFFSRTMLDEARQGGGSPGDGRWAGLDVAREGNDRTVLIRMEDGEVVGVDSRAVTTIPEVAQMAREAMAEGYVVNIDDGGVGGGASDILEGDGFKPGQDFHKILSGATAQQNERYPNTRSELWGVAAEKTRKGQVDLSGLSAEDYRQLVAELTGTGFIFDSKGRRRAEAKDQTKKRMGRSPDLADAFNLALWRPHVEKVTVYWS